MTLSVKMCVEHNMPALRPDPSGHRVSLGGWKKVARATDEYAGC